jgi:hypothetical protein
VKRKIVFLEAVYKTGSNTFQKIHDRRDGMKKITSEDEFCRRFPPFNIKLEEFTAGCLSEGRDFFMESGYYGFFKCFVVFLVSNKQSAGERVEDWHHGRHV